MSFNLGQALRDSHEEGEAFNGRVLLGTPDFLQPTGDSQGQLVALHLARQQLFPVQPARGRQGRTRFNQALQAASESPTGITATASKTGVLTYDDLQIGRMTDAYGNNLKPNRTVVPYAVAYEANNNQMRPTNPGEHLADRFHSAQEAMEEGNQEPFQRLLAFLELFMPGFECEQDEERTEAEGRLRYTGEIEPVEPQAGADDDYDGETTPTAPIQKRAAESFLRQFGQRETSVSTADVDDSIAAIL